MQPLRIPADWALRWNNFYEIDPDATIETLGFEPQISEPIGDLWDDFLFLYFSSSYLWWATRKDNLVSIAVEWAPIGDRNGEFVLSLGRSQSLKFPQQPKRTIKRKWCDAKISYNLNPPVISTGEFERVFCSRDRLEIVKVLESWLLEESNHP